MRALQSIPYLLTVAAVTAGCGGGADPISPPPPPPPPPLPAPVASVTLSAATGNLVPNQTLQLTATPRDLQGSPLTGRVISWTSSTANASVTAGLVTGLLVGGAQITATSEGQSAQAAITVADGGFVPAAGGQIVAAGGNVVIDVPAGATPAGIAITVTPVAAPQMPDSIVAGTAYDFGPNGTQFAQPLTVKLKYAAAAVPVGSTPALFKLRHWNGQRWEALASVGGGNNVATRTVSGQVSSFSLWATSWYPQGPDVATASVDPTSASLAPGQTRQLSHTFRDGVGTVVPLAGQWSTDNQAVATVDDAGLVTAVSAGQASIKVGTGSFAGAIQAFAQITVTGAPTGTTAGNTLSTWQATTCAVGIDGVVSCWGWGTVWNTTGRRAQPHPVNTSLRFTQVAVGNTHACGLATNGTLHCWGDYPGRLVVNNPTPVQLGSRTDWQLVTTGGGFVCALTTGNDAYCQGNNGSGQLGTGNTTHSTSLVPVVGGLKFTSIDAGDAHTCGITTTGTTACWGEGSGSWDGTRPLQNEPSPVLVNVPALRQVRAGEGSTCGITALSKLYCWGDNGDGQLGNGAVSTRDVPKEVNGGLFFSTVDAGNHTSCAVTTTGQTWCWGRGNNGQLGDGVLHTGPTASPVLANTPAPFVQVVTGTWHTCGLTSSGQAQCVGLRTEGATGDGEWEYSSSPRRVMQTGGVLDVGTSGRYSRTNPDSPGNACLVSAGNDLFCWGTTGASPEILKPLAFAAGTKFKSFFAGPYHWCAIALNDDAYCWGENRGGELGRGAVGGANDAIGPISGGLKFKQLALGWPDSCGITLQDDLYCWGYTFAGSNPGIPVQRLPGPDWVNVAVGARNGGICAVNSTGGLVCGKVRFGETLVDVTGGKTWKEVAGNENFNCALTTGGEVYCLFVGQTALALEPGGHLFEHLYGGGLAEHICGLKAGGAAFCWRGGNTAGASFFGEYGQGGLNTGTGTTPVQVVGGHQFTRLALGSRATCGVTPANEAYCWGINGEGLLGVNRPSNPYLLAPAPVLGSLTFKVF